MNVWMELLILSVGMGVALAMDAFSVAMANGLNDTKMKKNKILLIAGTFAGFQFAMPMIGWFCVNSIKEMFEKFEKFIPWIALVLLVIIGGKMLIDGIKGEEDEQEAVELNLKILAVQGIATSIDALSTGFTTAHYDLIKAFISSVIIAIVTFFLCVIGVLIGKKFGTKLAGAAQIMGGIILIAIGIKICFFG